MRYLLWAGLALVVIWWLSARGRRGDSAGGHWAQPTPRDAVDTVSPATQMMMCCAHCRVHMPLQSVVWGAPDDRGQRAAFCCEDHREAGVLPNA